MSKSTKPGQSDGKKKKLKKKTSSKKFKFFSCATSSECDPDNAPYGQDSPETKDFDHQKAYDSHKYSRDRPTDRTGVVPDTFIIKEAHLRDEHKLKGRREDAGDHQGAGGDSDYDNYAGFDHAGPMNENTQSHRGDTASKGHRNFEVKAKRSSHTGDTTTDSKLQRNRETNSKQLDEMTDSLSLDESNNNRDSTQNGKRNTNDQVHAGPTSQNDEVDKFFSVNSSGIGSKGIPDTTTEGGAKGIPSTTSGTDAKGYSGTTSERGAKGNSSTTSGNRTESGNPPPRRQVPDTDSLPTSTTTDKNKTVSTSADETPRNTDSLSRGGKNTAKEKQTSSTSSGHTQRNTDSLSTSTEKKNKTSSTSSDHTQRNTDSLSTPTDKKNKTSSTSDNTPRNTGSVFRWGRPTKDANMLFYLGKRLCKPDNVDIDYIHENWYHNMDLLERKHGYIQWLFPISESSGMNCQAQELYPEEAVVIQNDERARARFRKSYEMILHFYGMQLVDYDTGKISRAKNWKERFYNLSYSTHNHLRVTRILKCLGEMGLERYKYPFLGFALYEAIETGELRNTLRSCEEYWMDTLMDESERSMLWQYAIELKHAAKERAEKARTTTKTMKDPRQESSGTGGRRAESATWYPGQRTAHVDDHGGGDGRGAGSQPKPHRDAAATVGSRSLSRGGEANDQDIAAEFGALSVRDQHTYDTEFPGLTSRNPGSQIGNPDSASNRPDLGMGRHGLSLGMRESQVYKAAILPRGSHEVMGKHLGHYSLEDDTAPLGRSNNTHKIHSETGGGRTSETQERESRNDGSRNRGHNCKDAFDMKGFLGKEYNDSTARTHGLENDDTWYSPGPIQHDGSPVKRCDKPGEEPLEDLRVTADRRGTAPREVRVYSETRERREQPYRTDPGSHHTHNVSPMSHDTRGSVQSRVTRDPITQSYATQDVHAGQFRGTPDHIHGTPYAQPRSSPTRQRVVAHENPGKKIYYSVTVYPSVQGKPRGRKNNSSTGNKPPWK